MKKWKQVTLLLAVMVGVGAVVLPPSHAFAINVFSQCSSNASSVVCKAAGTDSATSMIKTVINTLLYILGIIAVVMIVIGGIRYTTSNGNSSSIKEAKDTILYSVVGLVVALLAFAIVNYVVKQF
jgi:hypothetical protein